MWTAERRIAALDIGGTAVKSAVWQHERLDSVRGTPTPVSCAVDLIDAAAEIIRKMGPVDAVGISTRGQVNGSGVILFDNGPVTDYTGTPVRALLERELGVPVIPVAQDGYELLDAVCGIQTGPAAFGGQTLPEDEWYRYNR